jgi:hypothetical protein
MEEEKITQNWKTGKKIKTCKIYSCTDDALLSCKLSHYLIIVGLEPHQVKHVSHQRSLNTPI